VGTLNGPTYGSLRGAGLSYNQPNFLSVTADMTSATWNTQASHEILTVTGVVRVRIVPYCTGTLTDTGDAGTIQLGVDGDTDAFIAVTDSDDIVTNELWHDATPTTFTDATTDAVRDFIVSDKDIGYEIGGEALTGGSLVFLVWWDPLSSDGNCSAGAGGAL